MTWGKKRAIKVRSYCNIKPTERCKEKWNCQLFTTFMTFPVFMELPYGSLKWLFHFATLLSIRGDRQRFNKYF